MPATAVRGQKLADELIKLSDRLEGKFRRAFLKAMIDIADDPELKALIRDIRDGRFVYGDSIDARLNAVRISLAEMNEVARQAIAGSAKVTKDVMNLKGSFDVVNDAVISAAKNLSVDLSTNLTRSAKESLRQTIEDLVSGNISETEALRQIKMEVGLIPKHAKAVRNYRRTLINAGTARGRANQLAEQYAKRLLKYRAETIARTEVARATGVGQTQFWRQMKDDGSLPPQANRVWITALDERACDFCRSMNGQVATIDGGWQTEKGYMEYPQASHPRCRCSSGITMSRTTKTGRAGAIAKVEELEFDQWVSKHAKHNQQSHAGRRGRSSAPKDKNISGGGSGKSTTKRKAAAHAKEIDRKLRQEHGDQIADTWKPLVEEALVVWHGNGDMNAPLVVGGKQISVGGRTATAVGVLDVVADALGTDVISRGSTFGEDSLAKHLGGQHDQQSHAGSAGSGWFVGGRELTNDENATRRKEISEHNARIREKIRAKTQGNAGRRGKPVPKQKSVGVDGYEYDEEIIKDIQTYTMNGVWSGRLSAEIERAPQKSKKVLRRGMTMNKEEFEEFEKTAKEGKTIKAGGSWSESLSVAREFAGPNSPAGSNGDYSVIITAKSGAKGLHVAPHADSTFAYQKEWLLPRRKMKIVSVRKVGKRIYVEVEQQSR